MNSVNDISEELKSMGSALAGKPRTMPYMVPDGYFDNFPATILSTIAHVNEQEQVPQWGKALPYAVPDGYFDNLPANITTAVKAEEMVSSLPKDIPLGVPAGYFDSLPAQMLAAARATDKTKFKAKTIPLGKPGIFRQIRLAAAAVLILSIGLGSYEMFFTARTDVSENMLASVPSADIHDYLQGIYRMDMDRVVSNTDINNLQLNNNDIVQYLNDTGWE
jgi:hypothetical protein